MRSCYTIDISPVEISINSHKFTLHKSDGEAYAAVLDFLDHIRKSDKTQNNSIQMLIESGCDLVDQLLGRGACFEIFGEKPISLGHIAVLCAKIAEGCLQAYRQYLNEEYLEGLNESI